MPECTCPHGLRPLGRLEGVNMGTGVLRLSTAKGCLVHDPATHDFEDPYPDGPPPWHVPPLLCRRCHIPARTHPWRRRDAS